MKPDPLNADPLQVLEDDGFSWRMYEAGLQDGQRLRLLHAVVLVIAGAAIGGSLMLLWTGIVRAAPRSAQVAIPTAPVVVAPIPVGHLDGQLGRSTAASGNLPGPTGAPLGDRAPVGVPRSPLPAPPQQAAAAVSGVASWYPARGLIAAAGPGLRHGDWRGSWVVVSANGRAVTVQLTDWCACPGRLIDLSDDAFRELAPLSRGLVRVSIAGIGPAVGLPPTDRSAP